MRPWERNRAPEPPDKNIPPDSHTDRICRLNFFSALGHADLRTTQRYLSAIQVCNVSASKAVVSALTQIGLQPARPDSASEDAVPAAIHALRQHST